MFTFGTTSAHMQSNNSSEMVTSLLDRCSDIPRNAYSSLRCRHGSTQTPKTPFPEDYLHPLPQPDIYLFSIAILHSLGSLKKNGDLQGLISK